MKQFDITYWNGPPADLMVKPEIIADIAACGMTLVPVRFDTENNKKVLPVLSRYGLRAIVSDPRMLKVFRDNDLAAADAIVKQVAEDYAEFDNIIGWQIKDEPEEQNFPVLAALVKAIHRYTPDKEAYINLFPNYATPQQLGSPNYQSHIETYVNVVRPDTLSYDHYHFRGRDVDEKCISENLSERERLIELNAIAPRAEGCGFFENIEDIRALALKYNIDAMLIVLLTEHGPYRNLTRSELFWEVNMCLAYGMRRISYFTYWEYAQSDYWRWANAMCDTQGNKLQHYYDVVAINSVIADIGRWLFDKTSTAVYHIGTPEAGAKAFAPYGGITAIDGEDGVIGFFDDGSVYLVNRNFQYENTFTIHTEKNVSIRKNGVFVDFDANSPIALGAGEAVLLKLS